MAGTVVKQVVVQLKSDDQGVQAKLDEIAAKAEELARLNPEITPKINSAAVNAQMALLRQELKDAAKADEPVITPKVQDADATTRVDSLKENLDRLGAAAATAKVDVNDKDAVARVDAFKVKLDEL